MDEDLRKIAQAKELSAEQKSGAPWTEGDRALALVLELSEINMTLSRIAEALEAATFGDGMTVKGSIWCKQL